MSGSRTIALGLLALAVLLGLRQLAASGVAPASLRTRPALSEAAKRAGLRFAPDVPPADRQLVLDSIARARPEARGLIAQVDGLVTVYVGSPGAGGEAVGLTRGGPNGFDVVLDLDAAWRDGGTPAIDRLVLHELGHVVDAVLVPGSLERALVAEIPAGYGCDPNQPTGSCAPLKERFAETFAKWATGNIGVNVLMGYKVLPPNSLEDWGAQLVAGARRS